MKRFVCTILAILSVLFWPWWVTGAIVVYGFFAFHRYIEGICIFLIADLLYSNGQFGNAFGFFMTLWGVLLYIFIKFLKARMLR